MHEVDLIVAGLTGGIASGKSTVAKIFKRAGAELIDADIIARQVVAPGRPAWHAIADEFGDQMIMPDGTIDRTRLGTMVFQDAKLRRRLEQIVHPEVRAEIDKQMAHLRAASRDAVVIQDIPLLFETGMTRGLTEVIVVYVDESIQLERLMRRDGIDEALARARIDAQMPLKQKCRLATVVIDNCGTLAETEKITLNVYTQLKKKAGRDLA